MFHETTEKEIENLLHNIPWLRRRHGFSKKRMAALLGISVEVLFRLCAQFGIHPKDLFSKRLDDA